FCEPEEELLVHRGQLALIVLNKFPYSSGHMLVAPHRHVCEFGSLSDVEALEVHRLGARGIDALRAEYEPHAPNRRRNHARAAGSLCSFASSRTMPCTMRALDEPSTSSSASKTARSSRAMSYAGRTCVCASQTGDNGHFCAAASKRSRL